MNKREDCIYSLYVQHMQSQSKNKNNEVAFTHLIN